MEFLRALTQRDDTTTDPTKPIRFIASTEGVKRDGQDLKMEDWTLDRWLQHPVILFAHDMTGAHALPIGTGVAEFQGRDLMIDVTFDTDDEFAMKVRNKTAKGMMGGSVSWDKVMQNGKSKNELLEFSVVPIPLDPKALPQRQARAWQNTLQELLINLTDENPASPSDELTWERTAADMVDLFVAGNSLDEGERKVQYAKLSKEYRKWGKTTPETTNVDISALGLDGLRGLFLEGEPEMFPEKFQRKGAVLSSRNQQDLQAAIDLINGVMERAKKEEEAPRAESVDDVTVIRSLVDLLKI